MFRKLSRKTFKTFHFYLLLFEEIKPARTQS